VAADRREFHPLSGNAFRAFGGVPKTLVIDNLRAPSRGRTGMIGAHAKWRSSVGHYGTVMLPTRPAMPHRARLSPGSIYSQENALKGAVLKVWRRKIFSRGLGKRGGRHTDPRHHAGKQSPSVPRS